MRISSAVGGSKVGISPNRMLFTVTMVTHVMQLSLLVAVIIIEVLMIAVKSIIRGDISTK